MSNEKVRFFRAPDLPEVELYQTNGVFGSVDRHVHSVFSASVTVSGLRIHETRRGKVPVPPNGILIVNVGEMHGSLASGAASATRALRIQPRFLRKIIAEITGRQDDILPLRQSVIQEAQLARQLLEVQSMLIASPSRLEKETRILGLFYQLYSRHSLENLPIVRMGQEKKSIARACEYLQACTTENVSLETLSEIAGLSPFHFSRLFTKEVGVPPHAYQVQVRLQKATDLLAAGCSVTDVAFATGFCDQSHLQKAFKRKYGITPGQYGER